MGNDADRKNLALRIGAEQRRPVESEATGFAPEVQAAFIQLAKARDYARSMQVDPWEFAVEMERLIAQGLTTSDLRWLVCMRYIAPACEITESSDTARKFRPNHNLAFPKQTCFVLTDVGALFTASVPGESEGIASQTMRHEVNTDARPSPSPRWDPICRVLRVGQHVVKRYRRPSPNQEAVLSAFQEDGWPQRIDDPLSPQGDQDPKCRLRDTIKWLNRNQQQRLICFRGDGTGEGVCWESANDAAQTLLAAARKKLRPAA